MTIGNIEPRSSLSFRWGLILSTHTLFFLVGGGNTSPLTNQYTTHKNKITPNMLLKALSVS